MKNFTVFYSDRSEYGLLEPIINKMKNQNIINYVDGNLNNICGNFHKFNMDVLFQFFNANKIDFAMCPFDRKEVLFAALACFIYGIPYVTLHSGDVGDLCGSTDHIFRHMIMMMSEVQLCNGVKSRANAQKILLSIGKPTLKCHNVGTTAFDDFVETPTPKKPFNVVILHPNNLSVEETLNDIKQTKKCILAYNIPTIILNPNEDRNSELITNAWKEMDKECNFVTYIPEGLPRNEYISHIKNCDKVIGNSSSFLLEAPMFKNSCDIIMIGKRNNIRKPLQDFKCGATDKILDIIKREMIE